MAQAGQVRQKYPSDLPDEQWAIVEPLSPPAKQRPRGGRPRKVNLRAGLKTLLSLHRSGGPWEMLPPDGRPKRPVYDDFVPWRDDGTWALLVEVWRKPTRVAAGRQPPPSAACLARQAVKTPELGGPERG